ncbi:MAG TPA: hypothetical protein VM243_06315, partial [Phycisphaerae bacterium]|nr:hypothetical protein [Phycisphaerae bacterium]
GPIGIRFHVDRLAKLAAEILGSPIADCRAAAISASMVTRQQIVLDCIARQIAIIDGTVPAETTPTGEPAAILRARRAAHA